MIVAFMKALKELHESEVLNKTSRAPQVISPVTFITLLETLESAG